MTKTAELADVVFPASTAAFESEGTVTNSERRVQRVRKALDPPGDAKDDIWIIAQLAKRLGVDWGDVDARTRRGRSSGRSARCTRACATKRLEELGGIQWPCPDESHPGTLFLHARLWEFDDPEQQGPQGAVQRGDRRPAGRRARRRVPAAADDRPPAGLVQHRRADAAATRRRSGAERRSTSRPRMPCARRGRGRASARSSSRRGLGRGAGPRSTRRSGPAWSFMTLHFPDQVETNVLTIEATDPKSGTAEFKATAVRIDKLATEPPPVVGGSRVQRGGAWTCT